MEVLNYNSIQTHMKFNSQLLLITNSIEVAYRDQIILNLLGEQVTLNGGHDISEVQS